MQNKPEINSNDKLLHSTKKKLHKNKKKTKTENKVKNKDKKYQEEINKNFFQDSSSDEIDDKKIEQQKQNKKFFEDSSSDESDDQKTKKEQQIRKSFEDSSSDESEEMQSDNQVIKKEEKIQQNSDLQKENKKNTKKIDNTQQNNNKSENQKASQQNDSKGQKDKKNVLIIKKDDDPEEEKHYSDNSKIFNTYDKDNINNLQDQQQNQNIEEQYVSESQDVFDSNQQDVQQYKNAWLEIKEKILTNNDKSSQQNNNADMQQQPPHDQCIQKSVESEKKQHNDAHKISKQKGKDSSTQKDVIQRMQDKKLLKQLEANNKKEEIKLNVDLKEIFTDDKKNTNRKIDYMTHLQTLFDMKDLKKQDQLNEKEYFECLDKILSFEESPDIEIDQNKLIDKNQTAFKTCLSKYPTFKNLINYFYEQNKLNVKQGNLISYIKQNDLELTYCYIKNFKVDVQKKYIKNIFLGWFGNKIPFQYAIEKNKWQIVKLFVEFQMVDFCKKNEEGQDAFIQACKHKSIEVVKYLLTKEVNVRERDKTDKSGYDYLDDDYKWDIRDFIEKNKIKVPKPNPRFGMKQLIYIVYIDTNF